MGVYFFPLFRVRPLARTPRSVLVAPVLDFDPAAFAGNFWSQKLRPAVAQAADAPSVITAVKRDPVAAVKRHGLQVGLGGPAYYFVHGRGRVVSVDQNQVIVAVEGADGAHVALQTGPVFGNTVRDGTGLLNVNEFPGLGEFNALSAELNRIVETQVFSDLRERAQAGAMIDFAGCAEAPESVGAGPVLALVPIAVNTAR